MPVLVLNAVGGRGVEGLAVRRAVASDHALIFNSWTRTYAKSDFARALPRRTYMHGVCAHIDRHLVAGSTLVLHPDGDMSTILGWLAHDGTRLHYVYVKGELRRAGLARAMLAVAGRMAAYTARTHLGDKLLHTLPGAAHEPWYLGGRNGEGG